MGLFGAKTTIYVSSVVYNMAGGEADRVNYLKTTIGTATLGSRTFSMTDALKNSYLGGPGIKIRNWTRWCRDNAHFGTIGVPNMHISSTFAIDKLTVGTYVPRLAGEIVEVGQVLTGPADPSYWAGQWIMLNYPARIGTEWFCSWDVATGDITITWEDDSTTVFTPINFETAGSYVYVIYNLKTASSFLGSRIWIYQRGDGIGYLDSLLNPPTTSGEVVPYIPIRRDNTFLSPSYQGEVYAQAKKAYTKLTGLRGDKGLPALIDKIGNNEDISDIDHCYIFHGISFNTKDNSARKYLFKFFDFLRTAQAYDGNVMDAWAAAIATYEADLAAFQALREDLADGDVDGPLDPIVSGTAPTPPERPITKIRVDNPGSFDTKLVYELRWNSIEKRVGYGPGKPGAKVGELWWGDTASTGLNVVMYALAGLFGSGTFEMVGVTELFWQVSADTWMSLKMTGLVHENFVYKDKSVITSNLEALNDTDESGFLVPLHYDTLKRMSLVDSTQTVTVASNLVFNCYQKVKQKWYQTTIFQILVFVVIIAITVFFPPAGAAVAGLLGTAAGVGAALGFSGLMAVIVGAIANQLAAMILMKIIATVSAELIGGKLGMIVATIASMAAMQVGTALSNGVSMTAMWGSMMSAQNLMAMTSAVGSGFAGVMQVAGAEIAAKTDVMLKDYAKQSEELDKKYAAEFGRGDFHFDPTKFVYETPQMFLDRTLMTGTDIADLTMSMLNEFASSTLQLDTISG